MHSPIFFHPCQISTPLPRRTFLLRAPRIWTSFTASLLTSWMPSLGHLLSLLPTNHWPSTRFPLSRTQTCLQPTSRAFFLAMTLKSPLIRNSLRNFKLLSKAKRGAKAITDISRTSHPTFEQSQQPTSHSILVQEPTTKFAAYSSQGRSFFPPLSTSGFSRTP